ncbi:hypothetical protein [Candidatus Leptofilum sp.]|uniref:hypothetical protein n=1 Tax=Candidatus Leptofilum sp. TaxID=3241576 RepID=UPI003B5B8D94
MQTEKLPLWLNSLTAVLVIFNLLIFGVLTLLFPSMTWPDAGETAVFPIQFFAIRHIAFSIPLLHGLLKQDRKILTTMFTIFFVIAVLDVGLVGINGYYIPLIVRLTGELSTLATFGLAALLFIVPMGLTLRYLRNGDAAVSKAQSSNQVIGNH